MYIKRLSTIKNFFTLPRLLIFLSWFAIVITNYSPNTWLLGWDNLVPEFNAPLNLYKTVFAAWQSWQGLGIVGGIGHASELSRQLILLPFSLLLPTESIRYIWTLSMILLGMFGTYQLSLWMFASNVQKKWISLVPTLIYTFNIATVQNFFVPLEAFSTFWGFLPLFLLTSFKGIEKPSKRHVLTFAITQFLGTSAYHVQTMFIVFSLVLALYSAVVFLRSKGRKITGILVIWLTLILSNTYWLGPVGYFTLTNANQTVESKQNLISTQEVYEANKAAGSFIDILQLKGYWFSYTDSNQGETTYLFDTWKNHTDTLFFAVASITISLTACIGILLTLFSQKSSAEKSKAIFVLSALLLSMSMLSAGNGMLGIGYTLLTKLPLLGQIFRVPFTKWSVVFSLLLALGTGYLLTSVYLQKKKSTTTTIGIILVFLSLLTILPIFSGKLFYHNLKLSLPSEYNNLFTKLEEYPTNQRILYLPFDDFWGWMNHNWNYRGSGFIWYGIAQPIIDRNFDVWSVRNETLYSQLQYAFQTNDMQKAKNLLEKYDISLILVDTTIETKKERSIQYKNILAQLKTNNYIQKVWEDGSLELYAATNQKSETMLENALSLSPQPKRRVIDFQANNTYAYSKTSQLDFPLQHLFREALTTSDLHIKNNQILIPLKYDQINIPPLLETKQMFGIQIVGNTLTIQPLAPLFLHNADSNTRSEIYSLSQINIELEEVSEYMYLDINNHIIEIPETNYTEFILDQTIDQDTIIRISTSDDVLPKDASTLISTDYQEVRLSKNIWDSLKEAKKISLSKNQILGLTTLSENLDFSSTINKIENCDALGRGIINKTFTESAVHYSSDNFGTYCDGESTAKLQANRTHFLSISSENITGLPLRFYVKNNATNIVLLEHLIGSEQAYFFIPPDNSQGSLSINIQNKSRGTLTKNTLFEATLYETPIPISDLANISNVTHSLKNNKISMNSETKLQTKKIANFFYISDIYVPHSQTEDSLDNQTIMILSLSQSFDAGWLAFTTESFPHTLSHLEVNGWKNGWEITKGQTTLYIIYWPQLLIFAGYIIFIFTIILFYKFSQSKKHIDAQKKSRAKHLYRLPKRVLGGNYRK